MNTQKAVRSHYLFWTKTSLFCSVAKRLNIALWVILYAQANPLMCWTHGPQIQVSQVTHLPSISASDCLNTSSPYYNKSSYWSRKSDGSHTPFISCRFHQLKVCIPDVPDKHPSKLSLHLAPLLLWQHAVTRFLCVRSVLYIEVSPSCQDLSLCPGSSGVCPFIMWPFPQCFNNSSQLPVECSHISSQLGHVQ